MQLLTQLVEAGLSGHLASLHLAEHGGNVGMLEGDHLHRQKEGHGTGASAQRLIMMSWTAVKWPSEYTEHTESMYSWTAKWLDEEERRALLVP